MNGLKKVIMFSAADDLPYNGAMADADDSSLCTVYAHGSPLTIRNDSGSTVRRYFNNAKDLQDLRDELIKQGCKQDMPVVSSLVKQGRAITQ